MTAQRYDHEGNPIGGETSRDSAPPQQEESLASLLQRTESEMQDHFPMMVDSATRLDAVTAEADCLHYRYTLLNASVEDLDVEATRAVLAPVVEQQANEMSFLKLLLGKGATVSFHYADKDGKEITVIDVKGGTAG